MGFFLSIINGGHESSRLRSCYFAPRARLPLKSGAKLREGYPYRGSLETKVGWKERVPSGSRTAENLVANCRTLKGKYYRLRQRKDQSPITLKKLRNVISEMNPAFYFLLSRCENKLKLDLLHKNRR